MPLRFISETIGASVVWDKSNWTVDINVDKFVSC
ncbi:MULTISPECIES: stalk domain-containing protein [Paenibacillus]